jgi:cation diffusion facilitator family transporter
MAIFKAFFSTADTPHKRAIQVTRIGFMLGVMLALGKFAAGHWGNSYALVADGLHSVSDVVTDIILIFGLYMASRPVDHDHNFGHGKFETVAAFSHRCCFDCGRGIPYIQQLFCLSG